jgi:DNA-binding MarR family transcriptional regulator
VVDEIVNPVVDTGNETPGFELPLLLLAGFRTLIDELHAELGRQGHPDARPAHGFALQAIGPAGATASDLGRRLGVSKQAAGKTVDRLEKLGYVTRAGDDRDARRKLIRLTPHGTELLARSAAIFDELRRKWVRTLGVERVRDLENALRAVTPDGMWRLDVAAWFS